jgi:hypothetical protein
MFKQFFIFFLFSFSLNLTIFPFTRVLSANDDGFFSVNPENYYNLEHYGEESKVSNQLHKENNTFDQNALPTPLPPQPSTSTTVKSILSTLQSF